jgi:hypothetical protein
VACGSGIPASDDAERLVTGRGPPLSTISTLTASAWGHDWSPKQHARITAKMKSSEAANRNAKSAAIERLRTASTENPCAILKDSRPQTKECRETRKFSANTDGANATSQERSARSRSYPRQAHAILSVVVKGPSLPFCPLSRTVDPPKRMSQTSLAKYQTRP